MTTATKTDAFRTTYHRDGTITYWSVYEQVWVRREDRIPDQELAARSREERDRICRHIGR
jgi:hypothetical protein